MATYAGTSTSTIFAFDGTCSLSRGCISAVCSGTGGNAAPECIYVSNAEGSGINISCVATSGACVYALNPSGNAIVAYTQRGGYACIYGENYNSEGGGHGVYGVSDSAEELGVGVYGRGNEYGVEGETDTVGTGVYGHGGVRGVAGSGSDVGVFGNGDHFGVYGVSAEVGVAGYGDGYGVLGVSDQIGVFGAVSSSGGTGVFASTTGSGSCNAIYALGTGSGSRATYLDGNVTVDGTLYVSGFITKAGGGFRIDHPLDPANKYLDHSFVESPDMKNMYDGVEVADANGECTVALPAYFEAANQDVRYQLTAIGSAAPNLHIKKKIQGTRFIVGGANAGQEICWQVTGIRKDAWANANRMTPEPSKSQSEKGLFLHPELYGEPSSKTIGKGDLPKIPSPKKTPIAERERKTLPERDKAQTVLGAARPVTPKKP